MPRKAALGLTLALFLINGNQANQRWFPCLECWFPLRRNHGFLTQEYTESNRDSWYYLQKEMVPALESGKLTEVDRPVYLVSVEE